MRTRALCLAVFASGLALSASCTDAPDVAEAAEPPLDVRALRNMTNVEALADFDQLVNTVRALYAPLERKQQRYGFSFEALVSSYRLGVAASTTDAAYRLLFEDFLAVLKDAHVSLSEGIADSALQPISLPFLAMPVEDTYVIASVYPDDSVPAGALSVGQELLRIADVPTADAVHALLLHKGVQNELAARHFAARALSHHPWYLAAGVNAETPVSLLLRDPDGSEHEVIVRWKRRASALGTLRQPPATGTSEATQFFFGSASVSQLIDAQLDRVGAQEPFFFTDAVVRELGFSSRVVPSASALAAAGVSASNGVSYFAIKYQYAGKRILLLRIPNYDPPSAAVSLGYLTALLAEQRDQVDGLILDQTHNPGGRGAFMERLVQLLSARPTRRTVQNLRADRWWYETYAAELESFVDETDLSPPTTRALQSTVLDAQRIDDAYSAGAALTAPMLFPLQDTVLGPAPGAWNKPLLILSDELSASCGDYFPLIMKSNQFARLFGARTMGAGGNVERVAQLTNSGLSLDLTRSLATMPDESEVYPDEGYIEDNGVSPDVPYAHSLADVRAGYVRYAKAFSEALVQQLAEQ